MLRLAALALLFAPALAAQPVLPVAEDASHLLQTWGEPAVLLPHADWEPHPALYWTGVALDGTVLVGGAFVLYQGLRILDLAGQPDVGAGAIAAVLIGSVGVGFGGAMVAVSGYDLARVALGDDPFLARMFDPTRLPDGTALPIPPNTPPQRPPGLPPVQ